MTELLNKAFAAASRLDPADQDELARIVLRLAEGVEDAPLVLTASERAAIAASKAAAARGEFASENDVRALWSRYGQ